MVVHVDTNHGLKAEPLVGQNNGNMTLKDIKNVNINDQQPNRSFRNIWGK